MGAAGAEGMAKEYLHSSININNDITITNSIAIEYYRYKHWFGTTIEMRIKWTDREIE
jgi:hypothetical protein